MSDILAIDFGTSNSAAAILQDGRPHRIPVEAGSETLPTAVFFPADRGAMRIGSAAGRALTAGEEGRYMRALKSVLGDPLLHEERLIEKKRRTLSDVITAFLTAMRERAEAETGRRFSRALSGRPVQFHSKDADKDRQAEADLRACYAAAGFEEVRFLYEPEAAALAARGLNDTGGTGLIVDIGGGTSDFSVFRNAGASVEILASHGIRLGGTDFDRMVSLSHAMPLLGYGGTLRREMGEGLLPVPNALFVDLATWARIPFAYTADTRREVAAMARLATDRAAFARLATLLEAELGHDLAFAVESGKIDANMGAADPRIRMGLIERGLTAEIDAASLNAALERYRGDLREAAAETLSRAGVAPGDVAVIVLVGGSSLMRMVSEEMCALCPSAGVRMSEAFTAVVDGLALATAE
ncbi:molecular chaperone DnaK [Oceanicola sp. 22II-s10i]|uniref:Hsp70 family protein n=1 Tax=Oceanicola sp. 22II-s10i TaxID=1317116 RepID=UPI000B5241E4|nr:Hsp70 family protein [Oceanicola sp. 22II-s10i]OWU85143.1 molecular chaperone DnaK [Oceanicola sp. 22II-s10i]